MRVKLNASFINVSSPMNDIVDEFSMYIYIAAIRGEETRKEGNAPQHT